MSETTFERAVPASRADDLAPTLPRRLAGASRIVVGLVVVLSIVTQIVDQLLNDAFVPVEYFSYFTIQTSLMNVVVLIVAGVIALRRRRDSELLTTLRVSILAYAVVTGAVYNVLLRNVVSDGFVGIQWPNEVIHVWVPIFIALDFLLAPGEPRCTPAAQARWCRAHRRRTAGSGQHRHPDRGPVAQRRLRAA